MTLPRFCSAASYTGLFHRLRRPQHARRRVTCIERVTETLAIRDALLATVDRFPRGAMELFAAVIDNWGSLCERRLWRALRWLVQAGRVRRVADGYVRVPDEHVAPSPLLEHAAEMRRRAERSRAGRCYHCDRHRRHPSDPAWFVAMRLGCCFACYQVRKTERRAA